MLYVRPLHRTEVRELKAALNEAGLPTKDLLEPGRMFFHFLEGPVSIAFGGIEGDGADRLLRSLLVASAQRGGGVGGRVLTLLENHARELGISRLHLLTNTAASFFEKRGYVRKERASAPSQIAASAQFSSLCPATAAYLTKRLGCETL